MLLIGYQQGRPHARGISRVYLWDGWDLTPMTSIPDIIPDDAVVVLAPPPAPLPSRSPWRSCRRGHRFTADNTYIRPDISRECRTCKREQRRLRSMS